jgi:hypothetical protein
VKVAWSEKTWEFVEPNNITENWKSNLEISAVNVPFTEAEKIHELKMKSRI